MPERKDRTIVAPSAGRQWGDKMKQAELLDTSFSRQWRKVMLRITLFEGSHPDDVCDYCRKQTGEEIISLELSGRSWNDKNSIQVHTKCLTRQVEKQRAARVLVANGGKP